MGTNQLTSLYPPLAAVEKQFELWRRTRKHKERIPDRLWESAIQLLKFYRISKICRTLRLNQNDFKKRMESSSSNSDPQCSFVEVGLDQRINSVRIVLEMEDIDGSKMRINSTGGSEVNIHQLSKEFWNRSI